ncbi:MAG TPA: hypothetical protein ENH24_01380, partial [Nitrospirae bacterium]|nr:hypothetical protein [Nitrospirota bacterium]
MNKSPKIIISYFFGPSSIPIGSSCAQALKELGCNVFCFNSGIESSMDRFFFKPANKVIQAGGFRNINISRGSPHNNQNYRQDLLEKAVKEFRPDILFVLRGNGYDCDYITYLKEEYKIKKIVGWWVKGPKWFDLMHLESKGYDHYFCIHREGYTDKTEISYLPALAVDSYNYRLQYSHDQRPYRHEVVFVGGWYQRRQEFLEGLKDFRVSLYGPKWKKKILNRRIYRMVKASSIWGEDLIELYNTAKISLNISAWDTGNFSGLNFRVMDVPTCGSFLLTDYSDDLREYFKL